MTYNFQFKCLFVCVIHYINTVVSNPQGLPFKRIKHIITEQDSQPTMDGCILIMVFGQLQVSWYIFVDNIWSLACITKQVQL